MPGSDTSWNQAELTAAEVLWVGTLLSRLRECRGFSLGIFADFLVTAALPGAVPSAGGTDPYDLTWNEIKVEVKSSSPVTASGSSHQRKAAVQARQKVRRLWADVYVLALHEGSDHLVGWSFWVVPRALLSPTKPTPIRSTTLSDWGLQPAGTDALPGAILAALDAAPRA